MTVIAFIVGVLVLVLGLALSIALHEIGHLVPAKLFKVRVGQYMIGFGPTLFSRRIGETEYGVKALPLGGYISMAGMYPPAPAQAGGSASDDDESTDAAVAPRRSRLFQTLVQDARDANAESMVDTDPSRTFHALPILQRIIIMLGGPFMNFVLAIVFFAIVLSGIGVQTATTTVASLSSCVPASTTSAQCASTHTPAQEAGLQAGDTIEAIDGKPVSDFASASAIIRASAGKTLQLSVKRGDQLLQLSVTPVGIPAGDGTQIGFLGFAPTSAFVPQPIWLAPVAAWDNATRVMQIIVKLPVEVYQTAATLVTGAPRDPNGPLSVYGVGVIAGEVASSDAPVLDRVSSMLGLLGSLNIALGVFNLIPLLPLDGGHVLIALWDGLRRLWARLRGREAPAATDGSRLVPLTVIVVGLLVVMGVILIAADILNPISLFR